jgi:predicted DNA-binding protein (MmcQ/YjbR family)
MGLLWGYNGGITMTRAQMLARVRKLCLALEETDEACPFGDPWFRVRGKMFCCFAEEAGVPCLVVKVGKENLDLFLAPYMGRGGWVCLRMPEGKAAQPDWEEATALIHESYNRMAPKKLRIAVG